MAETLNIYMQQKMSIIFCVARNRLGVFMTEKEIRQRFANNLKRILKDKKLTQKAFAEKLDLTGMQISRWLTLKSSPGFGVMAEICTCLGVGIEDLLREEQQAAEPIHYFHMSEAELFKRFQQFQRSFSKAS